MNQVLDEERVERAVKAFNACRPVERVACQDFGMQTDDITKQRLSAAISAYLGETSGWQPIETAPKDGTEINGYRPDQGVFTFRWANMGEFVDEDAIVDGHDTEFSWWWHDRWGWMENDLTPTHWRPLPPFNVNTGSDSVKTAQGNHSPSTLNAETE